MNSFLDEKVNKFNKLHKRKKIWHRIVTFFACIVVFCTTYALILPAITLTKSNNISTLAEGDNNTESSIVGKETVKARIISRDEIYELSASGNEFILFVQSGGKYYALDCEGNAVQVNVENGIKQGGILSYSGNIENICWNFETKYSYVQNENMDISIKSIVNGKYLKPNVDGFFLDENTSRPGLHYIINVEENSSINQNLASILWGYVPQLSRYIKFENGNFQNASETATNIMTNFTGDDESAFYCAVVEETFTPTMTATVISREEMYNLAATGQKFLLYVRQGNEYYAIGSGSEAIKLNITEDFEQGATLMYSGDDPLNISWDLSPKYSYYEQGNIDVAVRNMKTNVYLRPTHEGLTMDDYYYRPGFDYIDDVQDGVTIDLSLASIIWGWIDAEQSVYIKIENNQFQSILCDGNFFDDTITVNDDIAFYAAVINETHSPTMTAKVISREDMYNLTGTGRKFWLYVRQGDEYYALGAGSQPIKLYSMEEFQEGSTLMYYGNDPLNICWDFTQKYTYAAQGNIDIVVQNIKTQQYLKPTANSFLGGSNGPRPGFDYINSVESGLTIDSNLASVIWGWITAEQGAHIQLENNEFKTVLFDGNLFDNTITVNSNIAFYAAVVDECNVYFNPGNGPGTNNTNYNSDTSGSMFDYGGTEGIERVKIEVTNYVDNNGYVNMTFPSDEQLGTQLTIVSGDTTQYSIPKEKYYDYKLVGWYNIVTEEYYDVSAGSITANVKVLDENGNPINNVFYADWEIANSNLGEDKEGTQYNALSTNDFITTKVFDYNELFNLYSTRLEQIGSEGEIWTDTTTLNSSAINSFLFQNLHHAQGSLALPENLQQWNNINANGTVKGNWNINNTNSTLLQMLFDESGNTVGVNYLGEGDYLYHKIVDDNGNEYMEYDSNQNAVSYNQKAQRFFVWDGTQSITTDGTTIPSFLPLNDEQTLEETSGNVNYWFGVTSEIKFYLPDDVGTAGNKTNQVSNTTGENVTDMVFEFSSQDDAWIFIDDQLAVDLSGIHSTVNTQVNFSTGNISVTNYNNEDISSGRINQTVLNNLKSGEHTLKIYYLERSGGTAEYSVKFNMLTSQWDGKDINVGAVVVEKNWNNIENTTIPESVLVTLYNNGTAVETINLNENNEWKYAWEGLEPNGNYTIEESSLKDYNNTIELLKEDSYNYWQETTALNAGEIIIVNSNLTSEEQEDNLGYFALNSNLLNTSINVPNGVIVSNTITDDIIWNTIQSDSGFKLQNKNTLQYLSINSDGSMVLVNDLESGSIFNLSNIKGQRLYSYVNGASYSIVYENGYFIVKKLAASSSMDYTCARVYMLQQTPSAVWKFTVTNTYVPSVIIKKIDKNDNAPLSNVIFTLTNSTGEYYTASGTTIEYATLTTNGDGVIEILQMYDDTYTLTEIETQDGYNLLLEPITFTIYDEKITEVQGKYAYIDSSDSRNLTLIIENIRGYELPEAGGKGNIIYYIIGVCIIILSSTILVKRKYSN